MNLRNSHQSGLRDNHSRGTAGQFLMDIIAPGSKLSFVSAYFTVFAFEALKETLEKAASLRFLFGEPRFVQSLDPERKQAQKYAISDTGLKVSNQLSQRSLAKQCADWIERKVEIRSVTKTGFLHGKMYHIHDDRVEHALIGSSNFTVNGLGLSEEGNNIELNMVVADNRDRADLLAWFDAIWTDEKLVEDVKASVLKELSRLYSNQSPEFVYLLTLYHIFNHYLDQNDNVDDLLQKIRLPDTKLWQTLFSFQKDGAKAAINKILACNGCLLADSVGLGKTFTALAVIKYFELRNERVLVLCPKKLRRNWTVYQSNSSLNPFLEDRFRYDVLSHTDLSRESGTVGDIDLSSVRWGNYDLVVIDESHNFRNNSIANPAKGDPVRRPRYQRLMEDIISSGVRTKVLLLSATPVNNQLADLRNQISFIAGGDVARTESADIAFGSVLGIPSVKETMRIAQAEFTKWSKQEREKRSTKDLLSRLGGDFFKLLDGISIARSRRQIANGYASELKKLGGFPNRPKPIAISPPIDIRGKFLSFEQLDQEISGLKLALYHPTTELRDDLPPEIIEAYQNKILGGFTQEGRERILISMMKVNFLKRLESSIDSFRLTLQRTIQKIDDLETKIEQFLSHAGENPDIDYDALTPDQFEDPDFDGEEFTIGGKRRIHLAHLKLPEWLKKVRDDRTQLQFLLEKTRIITVDRDAKLAELKSIITRKVKNPSKNRDGKAVRKIIVFTAFADTARYLYANLSEWASKELGIHNALVIGDGSNRTTLGQTDYDDILTNFSPIAKRRADQSRFQQQDEIDLLIATDCISEGQNLQDCDLLVNYDIHWNPVRIIQRFGRIDRIGSRNDSVQLVNFWPVEDLDQYLKVKHRVEARMALVDLAATQTDNLLETDQIEELIKEDLLFRDRQLRRLKDEVLDLEDLDDSVSLTDFSLDEFRIDLLKFLESRREELAEAGIGLYGVVPPRADIPTAKPGVIFCLRHRHSEDAGKKTGGMDSSKKVNPLSPHYLVYIHDDGVVRFGFAQAKESLLLLRNIAAGQTGAFESLCDLFDEQTDNGANMSYYNELLEKTLVSIQTSFQNRAMGNLLSGRNAVLPKGGESPSSSGGEFDLVTWLVILDDKR